MKKEEDAMRSFTRHLAVVALVGSFVLLWRAHTDQDVVVAQTRKPIVMTLTGGGVSDMMKATGVQFSSRPPAPSDAWHTGPRRQYVITLSGRAEIEVAGGQKVAIGPGHINLIEDTTGKGHITRNLGPDNRVVITIPLEEQTVNAGAR